MTRHLTAPTCFAGSLLLACASALAAPEPASAPAKSAAGAAAAPASAPAPAGAKSAAASLPPLPEPARDWARLLAEANVEVLGEGGDLIGEMYEDGKLLPGCGDRLAAVDRYLAKVPVAVALWDSGAACARQGGDAARAAHYEEGLARLAAHAFARDTSLPWSEPIAIVNFNDAYDIARSTGMDVLYSYTDVSRFPRRYAQVLALWDEDAGVERHLAFDFVDVIGRLHGDGQWAGYPAYRALLREDAIKSQVETGQLVGIDMQAVRDTDDVPLDKALETLRDAAAAGGVMSLTVWLEKCDGEGKECGEGLVDALLPLAEEKLAIYRVLLALAQYRGIGTGRDEAAALALLDSAEKRWPGNAYAQFAEIWMGLDKKALPRPLDERLQRAADAGSRRAAAARLQDRVRRDPDWTLDPATLAMAQPLAELGEPNACRDVVRHFSETGAAEDGVRWARRCAERGDPASMRELGLALVTGEGAKADLRSGLEWMRKAADAGDSASMVGMGVQALAAERWVEAEAWYASAAMQGEGAGLLGMAKVYSEPHEGIESGPKRARELFELVTTKFPTDDARRAYASFLLTHEPRDPVKARDLLLVDAAKDPDAQVYLGLQMLRGRFGPSQVEGGTAWVKKGIATQPELGNAYAHHLYYRVRTDQARQEALRIERPLVAKGLEGAINNFAWWVCVSPTASVRNPAEGLAAVKRLPALETLDAGVLDTVAACHAASGNFAEAARVQSMAVDQLAWLPLSPRIAKELRDRLALYRQGKPYLEKPEDEEPDDD